MSIVSNTGPLIALAKVNQLRLLEVLYQQVHLPPVVHRELLAKTGVEGVLILAKQKGLIESVRKLLELMREHGYWLSDELITTAAELAGEE